MPRLAEYLACTLRPAGATRRSAEFARFSIQKLSLQRSHTAAETQDGHASESSSHSFVFTLWR